MVGDYMYLQQKKGWVPANNITNKKQIQVNVWYIYLIYPLN